MKSTTEKIPAYFDEKSMNYFDVEKEFFLIDSNNLQNVETKLYGYSVQESGIYENDNLTEDAASGLNGCGAYIYVEVKNGKINIRQDYNGSYGIYLYKNGDYFALSNSFLRLLEYVKTKEPLSFNRDFANYHLAEWYSNHAAYSDTLVREIQSLERDITIEINIEKKTYAFHKIDYKELSVWINSAEGIAILDRWFVRWINIFRQLKEKTNQIKMDLSGGFDTRIMFLLTLQSGINLNEIFVNSINDDLYTHKEDFKIASEMAEFYGFELNNDILKKISLPYSLEDTMNISAYLKMGFHKEWNFKSCKFEWKRYGITGAGGESLRSYYSMTAQEFRKNVCWQINEYPTGVREDMRASIDRLIDDAYEVMKEKYKITDDNSTDYALYLFREIDNRVHFGKGNLEDYFSNTINLSPYIDPELLKLRLNDPECPDNNLLMAVMYVRYCPKLLDYRFARGGIESSTIEFAQKINEKFGRVERVGLSDTKERNSVFHVNIKDEKVTKLRSANTNSWLSQGAPERYLKSVFDSTGFRKLFATCFDEEIYCRANAFFGEQGYRPMRYCYSIIAVTKVIEDVIASRGNVPCTVVHGLDRYIHENYYEVDHDKEIIMHLKDYLTARMDFQLQLSGNREPEMEMISVSDKAAMVSMPGWIQEKGIGYMVESYAGSVDLSFRSPTGGSLKIWLRGKNVSDGENGRVTYWFNYQNIQYNGNAVSDAQGLAWHDKPICLDFPVEAGKVVNFHAEWTPYKGDYQHEIEIGEQKDKIRKMQKLIKNREKEIDDIRKSHTFRAGEKVMYFPKKIKKMLKGSPEK